ncbi:MAG: DUF4926 domain-containing protein [Bacteroidota bacterium]|nr:DUF4926 domain-containing protein [Bacteroidota bacterium]
MKLYDIVRLTTDKYESDGIKKGDIGVILEDYEDGNVEVDFSEYNSPNIIMKSFSKKDLEIVK